MGIFSAATKQIAKKKLKPKTSTKLKTPVKPKEEPKTFESEMKALRNLALEPADRQNRAAKIAVKYGRPIKIAGKVFGPKSKTSTKSNLEITAVSATGINTGKELLRKMLQALAKKQSMTVAQFIKKYPNNKFVKIHRKKNKNK